MPSPPAPLTLPHAYHSLLKAALLATSFSSPARHTIVSTLRRSFGASPAPSGHSTRSTFDIARIRNTLHFLELAAVPRTLEGRVLKSLLHTWWWQDMERSKGKRPKFELAMQTSGEGDGEGEIEGGAGKGRRRKGRGAREPDEAIRAQSERGFEAMVAGLNESMGLCLPVR